MPTESNANDRWIVAPCECQRRFVVLDRDRNSLRFVADCVFRPRERQQLSGIIATKQLWLYLLQVAFVLGLFVCGTQGILRVEVNIARNLLAGQQLGRLPLPLFPSRCICNGTLRYTIHDDRLLARAARLVHLDERSGLLTLAVNTTTFEHQSQPGEERRQELLVVVYSQSYSPDTGQPSSCWGSYPILVVLVFENHAPVFSERKVFGRVREQRPVGEAVRLVLTVIYADIRHLNVEIELGKSNLPFRVQLKPFGSRAVVTLYTTRELDRKNVSRYDFILRAHDQNTNNDFASTECVVMVEAYSELNVYAPRFHPSVYNATVSEDAALGSSIMRVTANDMDTGTNAQVYFVPESPGAAPFGLDPVTGIVYVLSGLDYEQRPYHNMTILAVDKGTPPMTGSAILHLQIADVNEHAPVMTASQFLTIEEERPAGTLLTRVTVHDADTRTPAPIAVTVLQSDHRSVQISAVATENNTAALSTFDLVTTSVMLDHEQNPNGFIINLLAQDGGFPARSSILPISITLTDINDITPNLIKPARLAITELACKGTVITVLQAEDKDHSQNGIVTFTLTSTNPPGLLSLRNTWNNTATLMTNATLDAEVLEYVDFEVVLSDNGTPQRQSKHTLTVKILDVNDNAPVFLSPDAHGYSLHLNESTAVGTPVLQVSATDKDSGANGQVMYMLEIVSSNISYLSIHPSTGIVTLHESLDYDGGMRMVSAVIRAKDNGVPFHRYTDSWLNITVENINNHIPEIAGWPPVEYTCFVAEEASAGQYCMYVQGTDGDSPDCSGLTYFIEGIPKYSRNLMVDSRTGLVSIARELDREAGYESVSAYIQASDGLHVAPYRSSMILRAEVMDINDNPPEFLPPWTVTAKQYSEPDTLIMTVRARDPDFDANGFVTYIYKSAGSGGLFSIDGLSGEVRLKQSLTEVTSYSLHIGARDSNPPYHVTYQTFTVVVIETNRPPLFVQSNYFRTVPDDMAAGATVVTLKASDPDMGSNGKLAYSSSESDMFTVNATSGVITTIAQLIVGNYMIRVTAQDAGSPPLATSTLLHVNIFPASKLHCPNQHYDLSTREELLAGAVLTKITVWDADHYVLVDWAGMPQSAFHVDENSGAIAVSGKLNHTDQEWYHLVLIAQGEIARVMHTTQCSISIQVLHTRPAIPIIQDVYSITLPELTPTGSRVVKINPLNIGNNVTFHLARHDEVHFSQSGAAYLSVDNMSGVVSLTRTLQPFHDTSLMIAVVVETHGLFGNRTTAMTKVDVHVRRQTSPLAFISKQTQVTIYTNTSAFTIVGKFTAQFPGLGLAQPPIMYTLARDSSPGLFAINAVTGELLTTRHVQSCAKAGEQFAITLRATDTLLMSHPSVVMNITVSVADSNVYQPQFQLHKLVFRVSDKPSAHPLFSLNGTATDGDNRNTPAGQLVYACNSTKATRDIYHYDPTAFGVIQIGHLHPNITEYSLTCWAMDSYGSSYYQQKASDPVLVIIQVIRANSNSPQLLQKPMHWSLPESSPVGTEFSPYRVVDDDSDWNGLVMYTLVSTTHPGFFSINPVTGDVIVMSSLDVDNNIPSIVHITAAACDAGQPEHTTQFNFTIYIVDSNDNAPRFSKPLYIFDVSETAPQSSTIGQVVTSDKDVSIENRIVQYSLLQLNEDFAVNPSNGQVLVRGFLDYSQQHTYHLVVQAVNEGLVSTAEVLIIVQPVNQFAPECYPNHQHLLITENFPPKAVVGYVQCVDRDHEEPHDKLTFSVMNQAAGMPVEIDPNTRSVVVRGFLNDTTYAIHALLQDSGSPRKHNNVTLKIVIRINTNKHRPEFQPSNIIPITAAENTSVHSSLGQLFVNDSDVTSPENEVQILSTNGSAFGIIGVNASGQLVLQKMLDYEQKKELVLWLTATDKALQPQSSEALVLLRIVDSNDQPPIFSQAIYRVTVPETGHGLVDCSQLVAVVAIEDDDEEQNAQVTFHLRGKTAELFHINASSNVAVIFVNELNYDQHTHHLLEIQATNIEQPFLSSVAFIDVTVKDAMKQHVPHCFRGVEYIFVYGNMDTSQTILIMIAVDDDGDNLQGAVRYELDHHLFKIDPLTGELVARYTLQNFTGATFSLPIRLFEQELPSLANTCFVNISVLHFLPKGSQGVHLLPHYNFKVEENAPIGHLVGQLDVHGLGQVVQCTLLDGNVGNTFSLLPNSAELRTARRLNRTIQQAYELIVLCRNTHPNKATIVSVEVTEAFLQRFNESRVTYFITANATNGSIIGQVPVRDFEQTDHLTFTINSTVSSSHESMHFHIDGQTGVLTLASTLAEKTSQKQVLTVCVHDNRHWLNFDCCQVFMSIRHINRQAPIFFHQENFVTISRHEARGATIATVAAYDDDPVLAGQINYSLFNKSDLPFTINSSTGEIRTTDKLPVMAREHYDIIVMATDTGVPVLTSSALLAIRIQNSSTNHPIFEQLSYTAAVEENKPHGTFVTHVSATSTTTVFYELSGATNSFTIHRYSGIVLTRQPLDREQAAQYHFSVVATDENSHLSSQCNVSVTVLDVNDNTPHLPVQHHFVNISEQTTVPKTIATLVATDEDNEENGTVVYSLLSMSPKSVTGYVTLLQSGLLLLNKSLLDLEVAEIKLTVSLRDDGTPSLGNNVSVLITVDDVNEHLPVLFPTLYSVQLRAPLPIGMAVASLNATDADSSAVLTYAIMQGNPHQAFTVSSSGMVAIFHNFAINESSYSLLVEVSDGKHTATALVNIHVSFPKTELIFAQTEYHAAISEYADVNSTVATVQIVESKKIAHPLHFSILFPPDCPFAIDGITGRLYTKQSLDHDTEPSYHLHIQVQDQLEMVRLALAIVRVSVLDENDNRPIFTSNSYSTIIKTNQLTFMPAYHVFATDKDSLSNGQVGYEIVSGNLNGVFQIDNSGNVYILTSLEKFAELKVLLILRAFDHGAQPRISDTVQLNITIVDVNLPEFEQPLMEVTIPENTTAGTSILQFNASNVNSKPIRYTIEEINEFYPFFAVGQYTGVLRLQQQVDYETMPSLINVRIKASYLFHSRLYSTTAHACIFIMDINDNRPSLSVKDNNNVVRHKENVSVGIELFQLHGLDPDTGGGGKVVYSLKFGNHTIISMPFAEVDAKSGVVILSQPLDYETHAIYRFTAVVWDRGLPALSSWPLQLDIIVSNINDNAPQFISPTGNITFPETQHTGVVGQAEAIDLDGSLNRLVFSINSRNFSIDSLSGVIRIIAINVLQQRIYPISVMVTDGLFTTMTTFYAIITDVNQHRPVFNQSHYSAVLPEKQPISTSIVQIHATDEDLFEFGEVNYFLSDKTYFDIDPQTGVLFIAQLVPFNIYQPTHNSYNLIAYAEDHGGLTDYAFVHIRIEDINDCTPMFTPNTSGSLEISETTPVGQTLQRLYASDCDFGQNALVTYNIMAAFPVAHPFEVGTQRGEVVLSHTLTSAGVYHIEIQATDHGSPPRYSTYSLTVTVTVEAKGGPPIFSQLVYQETLSEDEEPPLVVEQLQAMPGQPNALPISYHWDYDGSPQINQVIDSFELNKTSGVITLIRKLRFIFVQRYEVMVRADDRLDSSSLAKFIIHVRRTDRNTQKPDFIKTIFHGSTPENDLPQQEIAMADPVQAFDSDLGQNGEIDYFMHDSSSFFRMDKTGRVFSLTHFDREMKNKYSFLIIAKDRGQPQLTSSSLSTVEVTILDRNDNPPNLSQLSYHGSVNEGSPPHTPVVLQQPISGNDKDTDSVLQYLILSGNSDNNGQQSVFNLEHLTGKVFTFGSLDFELQTEFRLQIYVSDSVHSSTPGVLVIDVMDQNDQSPEFTQLFFQSEVLEGQAGLFVAQLNATDGDTEQFGPLAYSLGDRFGVNRSSSDRFAVDQVTGVITTAIPLDREQYDKERFNAYVRDEGGDGLQGHPAYIEVKVIDINDNSPQFKGAPYTFTVVENSDAPQHVGTVHATDTDLGSNAVVAYRLVSDSNGAFMLQNVDAKHGPIGEIHLLTSLDREKKATHTIQIMAFDAGTPSLNTTIEVEILVLDVNDNSPYFTQESFSGNVSELAITGTPVTKLLAVDEDTGSNAQLTFRLWGIDVFRVHPLTGVISVADASLDFESRKFYEFDVEVNDDGTPMKTSNRSSVRIDILDENDNAPKFVNSSLTGFILENEPAGDFIAQVSAMDKDSGINAEIVYSFLDNLTSFSIDNKTGMIKTAASFDREATPAGFTIAIAVHDLGTPSLSGVPANLTVEIRDKNDNAPLVQFPDPRIALTIFENDNSQKPFARLVATDNDIGSNAAPLIFHLNDTANFTVVGDELVALNAFDYEERKRFTFTVWVSDSGDPPLSSSSSVTVNILDLNDNPPEGRHLDSLVNIRGAAVPAESLGCVPVFDKDTKNNTVFQYHIINQHPDYFYMDKDHCHLHFTPGVVAATGLHKLDVNVTDGFGWTISTVSVLVRRVTDSQVEQSVTVQFQSSSPTAFAAKLFSHNSLNRSLISEIVSKHVVLEQFAAASEVDVWVISIHASSPSTVDATLVSNLSPTLLQDAVFRQRDTLSQQLSALFNMVLTNQCHDATCKRANTFCTSRRLLANTSSRFDLGAITYISVDSYHIDVCTCAAAFTDEAEQCFAKNVCFSNPCVANGTCHSSENGSSFTCQCSMGYTGSRCQFSINLPGQAPACNPASMPCDDEATVTFNGSTPAILPSLGKKTSFISFQVMTTEPNGLVLYQSQLQQTALLADFVAVAISDGRLQVSFSLSGTIKELHPKQRISDGQWHTVELYFAQEAVAIVDHCSSPAAALDHHLCQANIARMDRPWTFPQGSGLYIGGIPNKHSVYLQPWLSPSAKVTQLFKGCLRQLRLHSAHARPLILQDHLLFPQRDQVATGCAHHAEVCRHVDCGTGQCSVVYDSGLRQLRSQCFCPVGFIAAQNCKERTAQVTLRPGAAVQYKIQDETRERRATSQTSLYIQYISSIHVLLRSFTSSGVIFNAGSHISYSRLQVVQRQLWYHFAFSENQSAIVKLDYPINDGRWYIIQVIRIGNWAQVQVFLNSQPTTIIASANATADGPQTLLSVKADSIFVSNVTNSFDGCLSDMRIDGLELPFSIKGNRHFKVLSGSDASFESGCQVAQCDNNATLVPAREIEQQSTCQCLLGFTGQRCEFEIDECASSPCPAASIECEDLVGAYRCHFQPPSLLEGSGSSDTLDLTLLAVVGVASLFIFGLAVLQWHKARKIHKIHQEAEDATVFSRDVVMNTSNQANVMLYHDEGGGEVDLESVNIDTMILRNSHMVDMASSRFSFVESMVTMTTAATAAEQFQNGRYENLNEDDISKLKRALILLQNMQDGDSASTGTDVKAEKVDEFLDYHLLELEDTLSSRCCGDNVHVFAEEGSLCSIPLCEDLFHDKLDTGADADDRESISTTLSHSLKRSQRDQQLFQTTFLQPSDSSCHTTNKPINERNEGSCSGSSHS